MQDLSVYSWLDCEPDDLYKLRMYSLHELQDSFPHPIPDYLDYWRQHGPLMQYLSPLLSALGNFSFIARPMQVCCSCLRVFADMHRLNVATAHAAGVLPLCWHCVQALLCNSFIPKWCYPIYVSRHVCVALFCVMSSCCLLKVLRITSSDRNVRSIYCTVYRTVCRHVFAGVLRM